MSVNRFFVAIQLILLWTHNFFVSGLAIGKKKKHFFQFKTFIQFQCLKIILFPSKAGLRLLFFFSIQNVCGVFLIFLSNISNVAIIFNQMQRIRKIKSYLFLFSDFLSWSASWDETTTFVLMDAASFFFCYLSLVWMASIFIEYTPSLFLNAFNSTFRLMFNNANEIKTKTYFTFMIFPHFSMVEQFY